MTRTDRFDLEGRVAVVTGASSGMGVTMAEALADAGARVVVAARREDRLAEVAQRIAARGGEVACVRCDVAREADVDALVEATRARFGPADVLVANAGFTTVVPAEEQSLEDFQGHLDVQPDRRLPVRPALRPRDDRPGQRQHRHRRLHAGAGRPRAR